jgi:hexosaminidase
MRRAAHVMLMASVVLMSSGHLSSDQQSRPSGTTPMVEFPVLPQPAKVVRGRGTWALSARTVIVANGDAAGVARTLAAALAPALGRTLAVQARIPPAGQAILLAIDPALRSALGAEGYTLSVTRDGVAIRAAEPAGLFYGTVTLRQLLPPDIFSATPVERTWFVRVVDIEDQPRFAWRGLMLDSARHFIPKAEVLRFVDLLALHKLNVLHWHLTDDQGWRLEIKKYPKLTEVGAWRKETRAGHERDGAGFDGVPHGGFYTQDDVREVVAYARERFVTVVPEIEMPGHAQAAVAAYPELGVLDTPVEVSTKWGINPYLFNAKDATIRFLQDVLTEVLALFPSTFIHVGGDEAIKDQWKASAAIQARITELGLADEHELQSWFIRQMDSFLASRGRRLIGWDEILEGGLAPGATVMSWRGVQGGITAARAGHDVVMTPTTHLYFDYYQTNDPGETLAIGGYLPIDKVYAFEPVPPELTVEEARRVLGAQANIWTEYIKTPERLQYQAFPRAAALAEVVWTPAAQRDFTRFRARLAIHEGRLRALGVSFRPIATFDAEAGFPPRPERPRRAP